MEYEHSAGMLISFDTTQAEMRRPFYLCRATNTVEHTSRAVIERQLLTALDDKSKVAILASKQDLQVMIATLRGERHFNGETLKQIKDLADGLSQLLREAFPS